MEPSSKETVYSLLEHYFPSFSKKSFNHATAIEKAQLLYLLVYQSRFELVSHFLFGPFSNYMKTGEEFIHGLQFGQGGVCLERVMGLKYLLELFEIGQCTYVMGGSLPGTNQPIDVEAVRVSILSPDKKQLSPYAHHAAILLNIDKEEWLLDANGGRFGQVFINPFLTKYLLSNEPEQKFGIMASFGQMFYHRVPCDLFDSLVAYRRGNELEALDLICKIGVLVGSNFDVFIIPKDNLSNVLSSLYPHRSQTMCWQIGSDDLLSELKKYNLVFDSVGDNDLFKERINSAYAILNDLSIKYRQSSLQMVLRIANKPWQDFTQPAPPVNKALLMRSADKEA